MTALAAATCRWHEDGGGEATAQRCIAFIEAVGITVRARGEGEPMTQPIEGLAISNGAIVIDPEVPLWPGDVLHEAGHIAVTEAERRATLCDLEPDRGEELMAIAWSYAAARQCDLDLRQLFHPEGYKGGYEFAATCYATGQFIGADGLAELGMTMIDLRSALAAGAPTYPNMIRWLR